MMKEVMFVIWTINQMLTLYSSILIITINRRKHQKLWEAIESNDIKAVETMLNKLGDSNSLIDSDLYDSSG
jgi:hypothetical protein